ncbi:MAG: hypothetical protein NTX25_02680 [Proteobacteria bacterium]|nr:hypothetical protein [Pseudomonadota bacterium]
MAYHRNSQWPVYVSAADKRELARKAVAKLKKSGVILEPIEIQGRKIACSFWGKAWCENLEAYSDFSNRLPRGRTYVRNGSVLDLKIYAGRVEAKVNGSALYRVDINISALDQGAWKALIHSNSGQISTVMELLEGRISEAVMHRVTDKNSGLFPKPREISFSCTCPDIAGLCKHVAAAMYGVGHRLDDRPELLFLLRKVDHEQLIQSAASPEQLLKNGQDMSHRLGDDEDLAGLFGIDIEQVAISNLAPQFEKSVHADAKPSALKKSAVTKNSRDKTSKKSGKITKNKPSKKAEKSSKIKQGQALSSTQAGKDKVKSGKQDLGKAKKKSKVKSKASKKTSAKRA